MADYIRPTPRNPILGLLADAMMGGLAYMEDPRRTQQMRGLGGLLSDTGIAQTMERLSYGEPLTTGRGMTTRLRPEAEAALLTLGPEAMPIGRAATAAVRATKGLPVGASIKNVDDSVTQIPSKTIRRFDDNGVEIGYSRDGSRLLVTVAPASKSDRMLSASLENIGGYPSGTGDATMAYVDALEAATKDARGRTLYWDGFTSESLQTPEAKAIYSRLKSAGIPFKQNVFENSSKNALSLTQQELLDIDFDAVRRKLIESAANRNKINASPGLLGR